MKKEIDNKSNKGRERCFVIMPISDPEGYESGHFNCVYEDIFKPAIEEAGYEAFRVDENKSTNLIQVSIIEEILNAPMAICDLSTRNPNVLFELGIRQAFDLPVVLVQEEGTKRIFDISNIKTIDYRNKLIYREVIEDRAKITEGIISTREDKNGINSIIKLLQVGKKAEIGKVTMTENEELKFMIMSLANEIKQINNSLLETKQIRISKIEKEIPRVVNKIKYIGNSQLEKIKEMKTATESGKCYKVYEVAKELDLSSKLLLDIWNKYNREILSHMSQVDNVDFDILVDFFSKNSVISDFI